MVNSRVLVCCSVLFTICLINGCSRAPQFSAPNRKVLQALQTAVSAKDPQWLEKVVKHITDKRAKNEMSDSEFSVIDPIIKTAQAGEWKKAQKEAFALNEAQRPLPEDLAMLKKPNTNSTESTN